nr:phosphoglucosamine mutase [Ignatzschineria rhizosphaerae]
MRKYFGTDGIRGKVGDFPLTPEFALKLGFAAGKVLATTPNATVLIGKDTRQSGDMLESALSAGLTYAGVNVVLAGVLPTPAIAHLTMKHQMVAGIVVSASHNPFYDNGIKFFNHLGEKLDDAVELSIEKAIDEPLVLPKNGELGTISHLLTASDEYVDFCYQSAEGLSLTGQKIVIDCAHGATYEVAPKLFKKLGATVIEVGTAPTGLNINDKVGSTSPEAIIERVKQEKAHCGIAFDGDGDRLLIIDEHGRPFDGDDILYLLATARNEKAVVGTIMSNLGFELALKKRGIELLRSKVGDRYVLELLNEKSLTIGGENSGHILCLDAHSTGDGIIAALQCLLTVTALKRSFGQILDEIPKTVQVMHNVRITKETTWDTPELKAAMEEIETALDGEGRILIRPSGTEPVVRVMVESHDHALSEKHTIALADIIRASADQA